MFAFLQSIASSILNAFGSAARTDESYLSQSGDVFELERRIRVLERRGNGFLV